MNKKWHAAAFALALVVRMAALSVIPAETKPWNDGAQYVNLAGSLADGKGFQIAEGNYWPGEPTIIRAPGLPLIYSVPFLVVPRGWRWRTARVATAMFDAANAALMIVLVAAIGGSMPVAVLAGVFYAMNPIVAGMCALPACEPVTITFLLLFLVQALRALRDMNALSFAKAGLMLACACAIRPNLLLIACFFSIAVLWVSRKHLGGTVCCLAVFCAVTISPIALWVGRNAMVCGPFPMVGAGGGDTFYGGNNDVSAEVFGDYWGRLVYTDRIPGETPLRELAAVMTEGEVNSYFMTKGWVWIKTHPTKLPGLLLGKVWKAYLPLPRSRGPAVLVGSVYRWIVYLLAAAGLWRYRRNGGKISDPLFFGFWAIAVAHLVTVLLFCGELRFVLPWEVLLAVPAASGVVAAYRMFRARVEA